VNAWPSTRRGGWFFGKLRDELRYGVNFNTLLKARLLIEAWRREYNTVTLHSSLGYLSPAPAPRNPEDQ
jgi:transposase InsO family protein